MTIERRVIMVDYPYTTIRIKEDLRSQIKALGRKGETYDDILRRYIKGEWTK